MIKKPWSAAEVDVVRKMYSAGSSDGEIADHLGRSPGSVSNCRQARGITRPRHALKRSPPWTKGERERGSELYAAGASRAEIAALTGRTVISVKRAITTFGWARDPNAKVDVADLNTATENWRVTHISSNYAVSNLGNVKSLRPGAIGSDIAQWVDGDGYCHVTLSLNGRNKRIPVHRLVLFAFIGPPPTASHEGAHNNGVPGDNRLANLRWATRSENQADRVKHGTAPRDHNGRFVKADMVRRAQMVGVQVVDRRAVPNEALDFGRG